MPSAIPNVADVLAVRVAWALGKRFRIACAELGVSLTDGMEEAVADWLAKKGKATPAPGGGPSGPAAGAM